MGHAKLVTADPRDHYPDFLAKSAKSNAMDFDDNQAVVIKMYQDSSEADLKKIVKNKQIAKVLDVYDEQYAELLLSRHAHLYRANLEVQRSSIADMLSQHYGKRKPWKLGSWVYFPWSQELVHILGQEDFEELRTIRNRDLITSEEQKTLAGFSAACFGMSVGSGAALGLAITGISRNISLIDGAVISGSNLNRILTGVSNIGQKKCSVIGRQIYEMNPYSQVQYYDQADKDNIAQILGGQRSVQIVIDEIDDIEMKIRIRLEARRLKIPVVMATELADTIMLDIERFDEEPGRQLFHGLIPDVEDIAKNPPKDHRQWTKHAVKIIDPKNMPIKMQKSLLKIGSKIVTHPQLGSTVMMTGGILAFAAKNIALKGALESGRYIISLEKELLKDHKTRQYKRKHKIHTKIIQKSIKSM